MKARKIYTWLLVAAMIVCTLIQPIPAKAAKKMSLTYAVHIQKLGDSQGFVKEGKVAGTSGLGYRLEAIRIRLTGNEYGGNIEYKTHVQTEGWQDWKKNGAESGSRGLGRRLEGIEICLTGEVAKHYDVEYRVHCQSYGWMNWVRNGVMAGTSGQGKRLEAIQIRLVKKKSLTDMGVTYRTHCQTYGWLPWVKNDAGSGTSGESKRLESIEIKLTGNRYTGGIEYKTHVQSYGWEKTYASNGAMSGTSGQAKRLEAIQIRLYGEVAKYYDVYYCVHAQHFGWLGWAKNDEMAGTQGYSYRLEKIRIKLVKRGADTRAEDNSGDAFKKQDPPASTGSYTAEQNEILRLCNEERAKNGVGQMLTLDPKLCAAAQKRAEETVALFSHTRPNGTSCFTAIDEVGYDYWTAGENIACGQKTCSFVMECWMNSPGHRANILNGSYKQLGVGCVKTNDIYGVYWVQVFASPW